MKNLLFKSSNNDLLKICQSIDTIQKNVLYVTYRVDLLVKKLDVFLVDSKLQKQVDEYFEEDSEPTPESDKEPD